MDSLAHYRSLVNPAWGIQLSVVSSQQA